MVGLRTRASGGGFDTPHPSPNASRRLRVYGTAIIAGSLHGPLPVFFLPTPRARIQTSVWLGMSVKVVRQPDEVSRCFQFSSLVGSVHQS